MHVQTSISSTQIEPRTRIAHTKTNLFADATRILQIVPRLHAVHGLGFARKPQFSTTLERTRSPSRCALLYWLFSSVSRCLRTRLHGLCRRLALSPSRAVLRDRSIMAREAIGHAIITTTNRLRRLNSHAIVKNLSFL